MVLSNLGVDKQSFDQCLYFALESVVLDQFRFELGALTLGIDEEAFEGHLRLAEYCFNQRFNLEFGRFMQNKYL